jgi:hypothetical protein
MEFSFELTDKGHLKRRESFDLEFKANFHYGTTLHEYCRSMVGMANNKGGQIVFGIQDKPRLPIGLTNDKFHNCDPSKINQTLIDFFSHEVYWEMDTLEFNGLPFGRIMVQEAIVKPIVCKKNSEKILREAAIYYRYRGETREIQYSELAEILQKERDKEKILWMKHIEKIGAVGPQHIHLIDTYKGEIQTGNGKILIDKELLTKLKFIKEGQFVEKNGAPALKLVGEISGLVDTNQVPHFDKVYPYRAEEVQERLGINGYEFQLLIREFQIKGDAKYHAEIKTGATSKTHKYSERLIAILNDRLKQEPSLLKNLRLRKLLGAS